MDNIFENIKNIFKQDLTILWIFSILLGVALIVLQAKNKLPLRQGDFVFIFILALCVALYRPRWAFFLFVTLVPIENIILASGFLPMQLRPYQFAAAILTVAIAILWTSKRLRFKLLKPTWLDLLVFSLIPLSFLSIINSPDKGIVLKNNFVLISFIFIYYIVRNFIRNKEDLIKSAIFFIGSNVVVLIYGFYQVFAEKFGGRSFEVMFGRPNSTFTEPDWLGIFLCFALAVLLSAIYILENDSEKYMAYFFIFLNLTLLILTLSRSAWIGAAAVIFFWLIFSIFKKGKRGSIFTPKIFANNLTAILLISSISITSIHFGKLSKFDIFDRARSTATSEQKITIACQSEANIPQSISNTNELSRFNCQHIDLEDINFYKSQGSFVTQIFRKDPNVMTRSQIYEKGFDIFRSHPLLGIGFGTITQMLGTDERGTGLNESNIFLQIWAGSGALGAIALIVVFGYLFVYSFRRLSPICPLNKFFGCPVVKDDIERTANIFLALGIFALMVPNLFNAGLFMGVFWLGLGTFASFISINR